MISLKKKKFVDAVLSKRSLADFQLPSRLYKFISFSKDNNLNESKLTAFKNNQVYLSSPLDFNDPYDCQLNMIIIDPIDDFLKLGTNREQRRKASKNKQIKNYVHKESKNLQCEISKDWNAFRSRMLVCCFTEHWDDFLMWSHYGNTYNGICIEYNTKDLFNSKKLLLPVIYTDKLIAAMDYLCKEDFQKDSFDAFEKAGVYSILSKHFSWSYENEWRLVEIEDSITKGKPCSLPTPTAVYFGHRIDENRRKLLIEQAVNLEILNLYDVRISNTEYKLIKERITLNDRITDINHTAR